MTPRAPRPCSALRRWVWFLEMSQVPCPWEEVSVSAKPRDSQGTASPLSEPGPELPGTRLLAYKTGDACSFEPLWWGEGAVLAAKSSPSSHRIVVPTWVPRRAPRADPEVWITLFPLLQLRNS